jgi:hypothetical protein
VDEKTKAVNPRYHLAPSFNEVATRSFEPIARSLRATVQTLNCRIFHHKIGQSAHALHPTIYTAGGLTSGIDLALHIVEDYFGREAAQKTADYLEYQGRGWKTPQ